MAAVGESRGANGERLDAFGLAKGLRLGAAERKVYADELLDAFGLAEAAGRQTRRYSG